MCFRAEREGGGEIKKYGKQKNGTLKKRGKKEHDVISTCSKKKQGSKVFIVLGEKTHKTRERKERRKEEEWVREIAQTEKRRFNEWITFFSSLGGGGKTGHGPSAKRAYSIEKESGIAPHYSLLLGEGGEYDREKDENNFHPKNHFALLGREGQH